MNGTIGGPVRIDVRRVIVACVAMIASLSSSCRRGVGLDTTGLCKRTATDSSSRDRIVDANDAWISHVVLHALGIFGGGASYFDRDSSWMLTDRPSQPNKTRVESAPSLKERCA